MNMFANESENAINKNINYEFIAPEKCIHNNLYFSKLFIHDTFSHFDAKK